MFIFKMGHSRPLFLYFRLFYFVTIGRYSGIENFADVGVRTADL